MNITTDVEEYNKQQGISTNTQDAAIAQLKLYFAGLLAPLQETIEAEEKANPCFIRIDMLPPMDQWNKETDSTDAISVYLHGYSDELALKIHQALSGNMNATMEKHPDPNLN